MAVLTFDEETHTYRLDGIKIPSVTQIIKSVGLMDLTFVKQELLEYKADLGKKVHSTTELYDRNNLDIESLHPVLKGYLSGWIKFREEIKFIPILIETMLAHPAYRYAGRIDRVGMIDNVLVELDIKSGIPHHSYAIQSAGYVEMYNFDKPKIKDQIKRRFTIHLAQDGTYKLIEHKDPKDRTIFLSALSIHNYLETHK